jgi:hypothetical protein
MTSYKVSPGETEFIDDEEPQHRETKQRPALVNVLLSIRTSMFTQVLIMCICVAIVSIVWGIYSSLTITDFSNVRSAEASLFFLAVTDCPFIDYEVDIEYYITKNSSS